MKIVILSNPIDFTKEHELINVLFEKGLEYFHLRKPDHSKSELEEFLKKINPKFYRKISIHSHYELIQKYNIGGIHLPETSRNNVELAAVCKTAKKKGIQVSTSFHVDSDMNGLKIFDYIFLSPVFDSISKEGYKAIEYLKIKNTINLLKSNGKYEIIALGGIEENKTEKSIEMGFDGMALLGAIWKNPEKAIENFIHIRAKVKQLQGT